MQIVRTIVWVLLLVAFLLFSFANWDERVVVQIWDNLVWETKLPAVVVVAFLIGLVPMWLLHLATRWQLRRRIGSLEHAARTASYAATPSPEAPAEPEPVAEPFPDEPRLGVPSPEDKKSPTP
jgi:lipopolysaccharide assembly protein A